MVYQKDMEDKQEFATWQELLGQLIKNSQEKQRLAREASVKPITLRRWVSGESQPREENIRRLARALSPDLSALFLSLIEKSFPTFVRENLEHGRLVPEIPSEMYAQVLQLYAKTPRALARQKLYELIFERAIDHLDPDKLGMSITLICCVPPLPGKKIRSLRQVTGIGTPPWERNQERKTLFLGAESVAGDAVTTYHMASADSRDSISFSPVRWTDFENSAIAAPILRQAQIAGALLASSIQPHYFTQAHKSLLELYAHLVALMFSPAEFYDQSEINLGRMPDLSLQEPYLADFERRVALKFAEARVSNSNITIQLAHQRVWQDIAEALLQLPAEELAGDRDKMS